AEWRTGLYPFAEIALVETLRLHAFGFDQPRVDGVDANLARAKLLCEYAGDRVHGSLGSGVHRGIRRIDGADAGADVDDAAALGADQLHGFPGGEQQAEHVEVELAVKQVFGDVFKRSELIDARVVHQNVELAVGGFYFGEQLRDVCRFRNV